MASWDRYVSGGPVKRHSAGGIGLLQISQCDDDVLTPRGWGRGGHRGTHVKAPEVERMK